MSITVEQIAADLKVTLDSLITFLVSQGFPEADATYELDEDMAELVRDSKDSLEEIDESEIHLKPPFIVKNIADAIGEKANKLVAEFMKMGVFAAINQSVDEAKVRELLESKGLKLMVDKREKVVEKIETSIPAPEDIKFNENEKDRVARPPIVAVMGHVDHGKTSLLDKLRDTSVTAGEAGGITQHCGASLVERNGMQVTFLDTPGHAAFSAMRQRGANLTDIAILIIAADDSVNMQTKEALKHIIKAEVPMIIALNKIDLPHADPDRIFTELQKEGILTEEWGGDYGVCRVSAKTGEGLDALIERIHLEAEINEVSGNPKLPGRGIVVEGELEQGKGATASIILQEGTIKQGDVVICGEFYGKVKALIDNQDKRLKKLTPGLPAKVLGLNGVPEVGAIMAVCKNEREAKKIAAERLEHLRQQKLNKPKITSFQDLIDKVQENEKKNHKVIIKTDVRGTGEAIITELSQIESELINLEIVQSGVGAITENDVEIAASSGAELIGFHVRTNPGVNKKAKAKGVEIKLYSIIYELIDDIHATMTGKLDKVRREKVIGNAEILEIFTHKDNKICGCVVRKGKVKVGAHARVTRDGEVIYNGSIESLRRFKDNVKEVTSGLECGINLDNFNDFEIRDTIQIYEYEEIAGKL